jgi:hypothetical protein
LITLGKEIFGMGRLMATGTTIQVFLPDGNPRNLKISEIISRTVQAILIPRAKLGNNLKRTWEQWLSITSGKTFTIIGGIYL